MNVGFTGIQNFGQVGFMAIGAYTMAILTAEEDWNFWLSLPVAIAVAVGFGLLIGLPSLRLRADYFAIVTIAAAEAIRLVALNARDLTNGAQGIFGFDDSWNSHLRVDRGVHRRPRVDRRPCPVPALPGHLGIGDPAHVRLHPHPAHALGARPASRARGRGRRSRAGQERVLLQAPVAGASRRPPAPLPASCSRST